MTSEEDKCSERELLERMRKILVGDDDPKTGLVYMLDRSIESQNSIKDDVSDIKGHLREKLGDVADSIKRLAIMYDATLDAAAGAVSALSIMKVEKQAIERSEKEEKERKKVAEELKVRNLRDHWQRIFWIITAILALIGLGLNLYVAINK